MTALPVTQPNIAVAKVALRSLLVGLLYTLANLAETALLGPQGRQPATIAQALVWLFGGTVTCLVLAPFVGRSTWSRRSTIFGVWAALSAIGPIGLGIEGALFKPMASSGEAILGAAIGIVIRLIVAWSAVALLSPPAAPPSASSGFRLSAKWIGLVLLGGIAYIVLYFVFGAANFLLYSGPFYESHPEYGLVLPEPRVVFLAQLIRGPLMALGAVLLAQMVRASRRQLALWLGLFLFVVGGMAPFVEVVFLTMPLGFNLATLTELLLQNFLLGVFLAFLYTSGRQPEVA